MKHLYLLFYALVIFSVHRLSAQTFSVAHDTVWMTAGTGVMQFRDSVTSNMAGGDLPIEWRITETNFPADWRTPASAFCDPYLCYDMGALWPSSIVKTMAISPGPHPFYLAMDFSATTSWGCYYVKVRMNNATFPTDTATQTYMICKPATAQLQQVRKEGEVVLYPNPASSELNIVYNADAGVKTIAIYDIIGKVKAVYKAGNDKSANLNLASIAPGIYFVRLMTAEGAVVATRKFIRQ